MSRAHTISSPVQYRSISACWEESRRSGVLAQLYRDCFGRWSVLKCARAYAKQVSEIRNAKLIRLLEEIFSWIRVRSNAAYRKARSRLVALSQIGKFRIGVWGSAGLRDEDLQFYRSLKNASAPFGTLIDLYVQSAITA